MLRNALMRDIALLVGRVEGWQIATRSEVRIILAARPKCGFLNQAKLDQ